MKQIDAARAALTLALFLFRTLAGDETPDGAARVVLPLERYEELRKPPAKSAASLTVIDAARFRGTFAGGKLTLTIDGRALGERPEEAILTSVDGFSLHDCDGAASALIRRAGAGKLALLPLAERFRVSCAVAAAPGVERLSFRATPAVLFVGAEVADGRLDQTLEDDDGVSMTLLRTTQTHEVQPVTATGRYRITLLPDEVQFRYELVLHNPNRGPAEMVANLSSGERVERAEPAWGEVGNGKYRVEAPPGDSTLTLEGRLIGDRFTPPLEASAQLVLVETHPLVKAVLGGPSRRIGPREVGVATQYRGGQGFLLHGAETLTWKVSVAEALRTDDALVRQIRHRVYVGEDGRTLAESQLVVDNQGAPDLEAVVKEPLFASAQGAPVLLMPDGDALRLPLEAGEQQLLVQYRDRLASVLGLVVARVPLLSTPIEASAELVDLRLPSGWHALAVRFGDAWSGQAPGRAALSWLLLLGLLAERALAGLGLASGPRSALAAALSVAAIATAEVFGLLLLALAACGLLWVAGRVPAGRLTLGKITVALGLLVGFVLFLGWQAARHEYMGMAASGTGGLGSISAGYPDLSAWRWLTGGLFPPQPTLPVTGTYQRGYDVGVPGSAPATAAPTRPGANVAPTYRGLPVRRSLPEGVRRIDLAQESASRPHLLVILVAAGWVSLGRVVLVLVAVALGARHRRALAAGIRRAVARVAERNHGDPGSVGSCRLTDEDRGRGREDEAPAPVGA